jgi:hypothetical protein
MALSVARPRLRSLIIWKTNCAVHDNIKKRPNKEETGHLQAELGQGPCLDAVLACGIR